MSEKFLDTYLYIKQHSVTGLLYFGRTTKTEQQLLKEYAGSGDYWLNHLKVHGKEHVETVWYCLFTEKEELIKFAVMCSTQWDIINAKDSNGKKIWANLRIENGIDGANRGWKQTEKQKKEKSIQTKKSILLMSDKERKDRFGSPGNKNGMFGKTSPLNGEKIGKQSPEHIEKLSIARKGKPKPKIVTRLIDKKELSIQNFTHWCNQQDKKICI